MKHQQNSPLDDASKIFRSPLRHVNVCSPAFANIQNFLPPGLRNTSKIFRPPGGAVFLIITFPKTPVNQQKFRLYLILIWHTSQKAIQNLKIDQLEDIIHSSKLNKTKRDISMTSRDHLRRSKHEKLIFKITRPIFIIERRLMTQIKA